MESGTKSGLTLATKITLMRILGVPVFILLLVYYTLAVTHGEEGEGYRVAALCLFILVAATDALDGYAARSRNEVTNLGRVLDPVADKGLLLSGLILLSRPALDDLRPQIPLWFTTLVISRDALLVGGYFLIHHFSGRVHVQPRWSGKTATVLQMGLIIWVLLQMPSPLFGYALAVAGILTAVSFLQYAADGARQLGSLSRAAP